MRPECITAVTKAIGRALNAAEIKGIEDRISRHMRQNAIKDPNGALSMSPEQRLNEAATSAAKELVYEAQKKKQRVAQTILAHDRIQRHLEQFPDMFDGLDRMIAFHADGKANTLSVESRARAIERDALRQMLDTLEATNPKFFGLLENPEGVQMLVKELHGQKTGDVDAAQGAKVFHEIAARLRERFNRSGGDVGQLDDWGMPHHHSQAQVAKAGRQQWATDVLPLLDRKRYVNEDGTRMTDAEVGDFLGHAWASIATGGVNKLEPGRGGMGSGMRANRGNESRQVHFKDGEAYIQYQQKYGERSLYEVLTGHIAGVSKDIALVETFGPNPDLAYSLFRDRAVKEQTLADPTKVGRLQKRAISSENLYNYVAGRTQPVASARLAETFDTLRSWMTASRLGSAVITSFSDDATMYLSAHVNKLPAMRLFANELAALNPANRMEKRMAMRAGLAMNTLLSSLNRFGADTFTSDAPGFLSALSNTSTKLAGATLRASGLNALTEARKRAYGVTFMHALGAVTKEHKALSALDAADHRILLSKGITETDFTVWKRASLEDWGGGNDAMLTPDAIYRIPDAKLADLGNPQKLREDAATRLLGVVLEETDVAVIEPGAKERAMMMSGLQRGTWKGELTRSFFLFKSFPIAMMTRHIQRGWSMPTGTGRAAYIASLIASTTVMGAVSLQINEMLSGRDPRDITDPRFGVAAMLKGGSLGLYGDFLFSESSRYGQSPFAAALGPVAGLAEDVLKLTQGNLMEAAEGKDTHAGAEAVRFVKSNTPGANLWYSKAALDHLLFHQLQEYFSPGYLRKMRRRSEKEFGQKYWWEPGEVVPDRAPDMAAMAGETA
ncbi:hypothetical protein [Stenotrophomonas sp. BIGb0135]|uniref:hypothetical protein n=1 Tax=Stenotrophomonas sp. BIGb0135 TaxID=2940620 RepID=UPI002167DBE9|nr:hypothetical protein [Stenotrophomonas sp. BIGb0135]MCS4235038.1 hypothetical protein [Stenotrophomonas sp. BIGb0135]MCS4235093.1 hypothetical protein [Stenotrophomonas sp. BIGb0135]